MASDRMSGVKDVLKKGWHPEKEGTTLKQQVSSVFRRGDGGERHNTHSATPISQLRDPASFAPPPKRTTSIVPPPLAPGSSAYSEQDTHAPSPPPQPHRYTPPAPAPRRNAAQPSPSPQSPGTASPAPIGPPRLPPRLPPRNAPPPTQEADPSTGALNRGAVSRLGAAGISVPGLGIGSSNKTSSAGSPSEQSSWGGVSSQISGLSSRFDKLGTSSSSPSLPPPPPAAHSATHAPSPPSAGGGTTFAQKQAAFKTAANFRKDPSSVSLSDARTAASTANNFRQRHGEQVAAGLQTANGLNQKYGIADRVSSYQQEQAGGHTTSPQSGASANSMSSTASAAVGLLAKKKPPPPPPPKRKPTVPATGAAVSGEVEAPPPIPMSTRPTF